MWIRNVVIVGVACLILGACGSAPSTGDASAPESGTWRIPASGFVDVPSSPTGVVGLIVALTDGTFLGYGSDPSPGFGSRPPLNAQVFDPEDGSWTVVPPEPFGPVYAPQVVPTVDGFVVMGVHCDREDGDTEVKCDPGDFVGASFDVGSQKWTTIEPPSGAELPSDVSDAVQVEAAVSGGPLLVKVGPEYHLYDPDASVWSSVDAPIASEGLCGTGHGFVSIRLGTSDPSDRTASDVDRGRQSDFAASVLVDGRWMSTPNDAAPAGPAAELNGVVCTAESVVILGTDPGLGNPYAYRFTPDDRRWKQIDLPPSDVGYPLAVPVASGAVVASTDAATYLFSDETQRWSRAATDLRDVADAAISSEGIFVGARVVGAEDSALQVVAVAARVTK